MARELRNVLLSGATNAGWPLAMRRYLWGSHMAPRPGRRSSRKP